MQPSVLTVFLRSLCLFLVGAASVVCIVCCLLLFFVFLHGRAQQGINVQGRAFTAPRACVQWPNVAVSLSILNGTGASAHNAGVVSGRMVDRLGW